MFFVASAGLYGSKIISNLGGDFRYFLAYWYLGRWSNFTIIFQMRWNRHLGIFPTQRDDSEILKRWLDQRSTQKFVLCFFRFNVLILSLGSTRTHLVVWYVFLTDETLLPFLIGGSGQVLPHFHRWSVRQSQCSFPKLQDHWYHPAGTSSSFFSWGIRWGIRRRGRNCVPVNGWTYLLYMIW